MAHDLPARDNADLYDRDFLAWTREQAAALRARDTGANRLDYDNLAEEVEDLGKSLMRACQSLTERIIEHLLKLRFVPWPQTHPHWRGEIVEFRDQLDGQLTRTIELSLKPEIEAIYARRVKILVLKQVLHTTVAEQALREGAPTWDQIRSEDWFPDVFTPDRDA